MHAMYPKQRSPLLVLAGIGETSFAKYRSVLEQENEYLPLDYLAFKLRESEVHSREWRNICELVK